MFVQVVQSRKWRNLGSEAMYFWMIPHYFRKRSTRFGDKIGGSYSLVFGRYFLWPRWARRRGRSTKGIVIQPVQMRRRVSSFYHPH